MFFVILLWAIIILRPYYWTNLSLWFICLEIFSFFHSLYGRIINFSVFCSVMLYLNLNTYFTQISIAILCRIECPFCRWGSFRDLGSCIRFCLSVVCVVLAGVVLLLDYMMVLVMVHSLSRKSVYLVFLLVCFVIKSYFCSCSLIWSSSRVSLGEFLISAKFT